MNRFVASALALLAFSQPLAAQDLRASGNEPFWTAEVRDEMLTLRRLGMEDISLPVVREMASQDGPRTVIAADPDRALQVALIVRDGLCRDTMAGMPFPMVARLEIGDTVIHGCAGAPVSLLSTAAEWAVDRVAGRDVSDDAPITISFDGQGGVSGRGGCNRYFGTYTLTGEGLTLGPFGMTRMACATAIMEHEHRFMAALEEVSRFDIDDTGALILLAGDRPVIRARAPE